MAAAARRGLLRCGYHYGSSLARTLHLDAAQCSSLLAKCSIPGRTDQVRRIFQTTSNADWKRDVFFKTLARKLELQGIPSDQIETITSAAMVVLSDSWENVGEMQEDSYICELQLEVERLKNVGEKHQTKVKNEFDSLTAKVRSDLNLEKGRIQDELTNRSITLRELTQRLERKFHALRWQLEVHEDVVLKYSVVAQVCAVAVHLALIRFFL